jgi:hypothetical protein
VLYSSTSNGDGNFDVPQLPEGRYKVTVEKPGFKTSVTPDIELLVAQTLTLNISLEIGEVTQSVNVGTGVSNVETTTSELATDVGEKMVIDLPLAVSGNMRNPESFIFLTPGVTGSTVEHPDRRVAVEVEGGAGRRHRHDQSGERRSAVYLPIGGGNFRVSASGVEF